MKAAPFGRKSRGKRTKSGGFGRSGSDAAKSAPDAKQVVQKLRAKKDTKKTKPKMDTKGQPADVAVIETIEQETEHGEIREILAGLVDAVLMKELPPELSRGMQTTEISDEITQITHSIMEKEQLVAD